MFKKIKMPKIKMPNVVGNVKALSKKIGEEVKGSTKGAVKSVKGLNPFRASRLEPQNYVKIMASKTHVKSTSGSSLQAVFGPLVARCALGTLP